MRREIKAYIKRDIVGSKNNRREIVWIRKEKKQKTIVVVKLDSITNKWQEIPITIWDEDYT